MRFEDTWHKKISKIAGHAQDESLEILQDLLDSGYDRVQLKTSPNACSVCLKHQDEIKDLEEYLSKLNYDAPIAEWTHPDDKSCYLLVYKDMPDEDHPEVAVYYDGSYQEL